MLTSDQIARVSAWCEANGQESFHQMKTGGWRTPANAQWSWRITGDWEIVGRIAEAAKAAVVSYGGPEWNLISHEWQACFYDAFVGGDNILGQGESADSPAAAAILAANAYLEAKEKRP